MSSFEFREGFNLGRDLHRRISLLLQDEKRADAIDLIYDELEDPALDSRYERVGGIVASLIQFFGDFPESIWFSVLTATRPWHKYPEIRPHVIKLAELLKLDPNDGILDARIDP